MSDAPIVERVARAICRSFLLRSGFGLSEAGIEWIVEQKWPEWTPEARASIAVQMELIQQAHDVLKQASSFYTKKARDNADATVAALREAIAAADAELKDTK